MDFLNFKTKINHQMDWMSADNELFVTDVSKKELWDTYLGSFPEGSDPIFRERSVHDCQCCKTFIQNAGNIVIINENLELVSIWDIDIDGEYGVVSKAMSNLVKSKAITGIFRYFQKNLGTDYNHELIQVSDGTETRRWEHFHFELPEQYVHTGTGNPHNASNEEMILLARGLSDIPLESINTVLELIEQGSIERGEENKPTLKNFKILQKGKSDLLEVVDVTNKQWLAWLWKTSIAVGRAGRIRNTAIGTLLVDIGDDDVTLDKAVYRFNNKMDPTKYKHPTSVVTKRMIRLAEETITKMGYMDALARRHANMDDVTINNVLFANRDAKKSMNVFDEMVAESNKPQKLSKMEEVSIDTFINDILPECSNVELLFKNKHQNNLMSLIAPWHPEAKNMLKWKNNFSWSYNGEVTDSIKEKVKRAGGNVTGDIRCSLAWFNGDDLDAHCMEAQGGSHIYYGNRGSRHRSSGKLDVDMNAGGSTNNVDPVENITYLDRKKMHVGTNKLFVRQFQRRSTKNVGFNYEIEMDGIIHSFNYPKIVTQDVHVADLFVDRDHTVTIKPRLKTSTTPKEVWNINTQQFHKVKLIMNSPNHWDGEATGNKHTFFILEGCKTKDRIRGFFNEFLDEKLTPHRKVFEVLGSKMIVDETDSQLSGVGFSSTRRNSVIVKVTGAFTRTLKIKF